MYFKELDSTNKYAKVLAKDGAPEFTVIIADKQTGGYGRMGRSFCSPDSSGLYMSIILRPDIEVQKCLYITTAAAVAVSEAIEETANIKTGIKWVNDIFIGNKKVCGILTEAGFTEGGRLDYAILGIGVNIYTPEGGFPPDIKDIAGSIYGSPKDINVRNALAESIIKHFEVYYGNLLSKPHLPSYKQRSIVIGKNIKVVHANGSYPAYALDIDNEFRLTVKDQNNIITALDSGEISIRM
ncbi:MAG: biotin--[Clostridia bacterium]|nr:biotin--[acetyl-CoA-carboxylase] ligase [Clostridia bacterium]